MRRASIALAVALATALLALGAGPVHADPPIPLRILALGDSLTAGYGSSDGAGYRTHLGELLDAAGQPYTWTAGGAQTGWTVQDLAAGVDGWIADAAPDLVILAIGTNNAAGVPPGMSGYAAAYSALVARILIDAPVARVLLVQVPYSNGPWASQEVLVNQYAIQASWTDPRLILGTWAGLATCALFDAVHPRDDGYRVMADQLYRALAPTYGWPPIPPDAVPASPSRPGYDRTPVLPCGSGYPS